MELSDAPEKIPQWPGIDPRTLRLVAQCLLLCLCGYLGWGGRSIKLTNCQSTVQVCNTWSGTFVFPTHLSATAGCIFYVLSNGALATFITLSSSLFGIHVWLWKRFPYSSPEFRTPRESLSAFFMAISFNLWQIFHMQGSKVRYSRMQIKRETR